MIAADINKRRDSLRSSDIFRHLSRFATANNILENCRGVSANPSMIP